MKTKITRNPWPIAIISFFVVAILFIGTFITWAVHQGQDLVAPDYYEKEIRFQKELEARNRAQTLHGTQAVLYDSSEQIIRIHIPITQASKVTGKIHLYRPSDARLDRALALGLDASGIQKLDARLLRDGLWKIRVQWSVNDEEFSLDQSVIVVRD